MKLLKETYLKSFTAYMLRDDGKIFECPIMHPYIKYLINDKDNNQIEFLFNKNYLALKWFFDHTASSEVQEKIIEFVYAVLNNRFFKIDSEKRAYFEKTFLDRVDYELKKKAVFDTIFLFRELNTLTNQEFCRIRTGPSNQVTDKNDIYFRISSNNFNWFDLIWAVVYDNRNFLDKVIISTDLQATGRDVFYIDKMSVDEFINIKGKPEIV